MNAQQLFKLQKFLFLKGYHLLVGEVYIKHHKKFTRRVILTIAAHQYKNWKKRMYNK